MKNVSLAAILFASLFAAGAVQAKTYSCTVTPDYVRAWISKTLAFNIDDSSGAVTVFDGIIHKYQGKPVTGKLSVVTAKRVTISWETRRVRDNFGNSTARFLFRASYYKDNGKMIISSIPGGWDNRFGGSGRCLVSSDAEWATALAAAKRSNFSPRGKSRFSREEGWILFP